MVEMLAFIDARLQSAHSFLSVTHAYIKWQAPLDIKQMGEAQTFKVSSEAMRVTARMTQIIAWLLLQKAVLEGDLTRKEAVSEDLRVLRGHHCIESKSEDDLEIPPRLRELLKESRELYLQVLRLDIAFRKNNPTPPSTKRSYRRLAKLN